VVSADVQKMGRHYTPVSSPIEEQACRGDAFLWLVQWGAPQTRESMLSMILDKYKADALQDAEFESSFVMVPYFFTRSCITVTGTPVKLKGGQK
jgi:hypothetical protein